MNEINWAYSHCGLYRTPINKVVPLMPELKPIMDSSPVQGPSWTVDVKVHMLMPGQWPCIPNWHFDNVLRDENNVQDFSKRVMGATMWLWLSGPPLTEFKHETMSGTRIVKVTPKEWHGFDQWDEHRGTAADEHGWRCFIRISPIEILKPAPQKMWLRRHSQVYLDAGAFKW